MTKYPFGTVRVMNDDVDLQSVFVTNQVVGKA